MTRLIPTETVIDYFDGLFMKEVPSSITYYICGGAIRDSLMGEPFKDIDIWCRSQIDFNLLCTWFDTHQQLVSTKSTNRYNQYSVYLPITADRNHPVKTFQVVKPVTETNTQVVEIKDILRSFDFSVNAVALSSDNRTLYNMCWATGILHNISKSSYLSELANRTAFVNSASEYYDSTVRRLPKIVKKGFYVDSNSLSRLVTDIYAAGVKGESLKTLMVANYDEE